MKSPLHLTKNIGISFPGHCEAAYSELRDVRRYNAAVRGTLINLRGQVELADVLGLEAIRIFLPDVFRRLPDVSILSLYLLFWGFWHEIQET